MHLLHGPFKGHSRDSKSMKIKYNSQWRFEPGTYRCEVRWATTWASKKVKVDEEWIPDLAKISHEEVEKGRNSTWTLSTLQVSPTSRLLWTLQRRRCSCRRRLLRRCCSRRRRFRQLLDGDEGRPTKLLELAILIFVLTGKMSGWR